MLIFVTSLRAKALAKDEVHWRRHVWLLEQMINSCLAQTEGAVKLVVVCHDLPETSWQTDSRVHFIQTNIPHPKREFWDMTVDKGIKISIGAKWALSQGARYVMYADADDLVSNKLAAHLKQNTDAPGWYFDSGYAYKYGDNWLLHRRDQHLKCGTCAIFRAEMLQFEKQDDYRGCEVEILAAKGHNMYFSAMQERGHHLRRLPFPGSIYISHPDSTISLWNQGSGVLPVPVVRRALGLLKMAALQLPHMRPLTTRLKTEFGIPPKHSLPPEWRT